MIISLTGFMGCGKSSVGRRLSELLCCPFIDLDEEIEAREGRRIAEIFEQDGEVEFRKIEKATLEHIIESDGRKLVLALGGGAIMTQGSAEIVHDRTTCIYLRAYADTLMEHLSDETSGRPLLNTDDLRGRIMTLMELRSETYESTAHHIIDTDGKDIDTIAREIIQSIL